MSDDTVAAPKVKKDKYAGLRHVPTQTRGKRKVDLIAEHTKLVLRTVGRDRFTTEQVAESAGVSIGVIYRYFDDKVDLLNYVWPKRRDQFYPKKKNKRSAYKSS